MPGTAHGHYSVSHNTGNHKSAGPPFSPAGQLGWRRWGENEGEKVLCEGPSRTRPRSKAVGIANIEYALLRHQASLLAAVLPSAGILRGFFLDMLITC